MSLTLLPDTMPLDLEEQAALVVPAVKELQTAVTALQATPVAPSTDGSAPVDPALVARVAALEVIVAKLNTDVEPAAPVVA